MHQLSLSEYEEFLTDLPLLNGPHQVPSSVIFKSLSFFFVFCLVYILILLITQMLFDTAMYRSKRETGEATYEYDSEEEEEGEWGEYGPPSPCSRYQVHVIDKDVQCFLFSLKDII